MRSMKKSILSIFVAATVLACTACGAQKAEETAVADENVTTETATNSEEGTGEGQASTWTADGNYNDGNGNFLIMYPTSVEFGYDKDGWGAMLMTASDMYSGYLDEADGKLSGALSTYTEDGNDESINVTLTDMGEYILLQKDNGEEMKFSVEDEEAPATEESVSLPAYEYPGPELFYSVLYQYLLDRFAGLYPEADVSIPCPLIVYEDMSDREDIKVYADFWINNYALNGDILETRSGGSHAGCIHIKSTDEGYEVIGMDEVGDGSDFEPTAKKIFGDHYDEFIKVMGDKEGRSKIEAQIIANYAAANNLSITAYQDYGWDPVTLPEENIDTFYSDL